MSDIMEISILDDGTIRVETDKISGPQHLNAEQFLKRIGDLAGGGVTRNRRGHVHGHDHHHDHEEEKA